MSGETSLRRGLGRIGEAQGIALGLAVSIAVALLFSIPRFRASVEWLEMRALDFLFKFRSPIRESPDVVLIDIDDNTIRSIGDFPFQRTEYARINLALRHLGAKQIVYDVQFKTQMPRADAFDPDTGEIRFKEEDADLESSFSLAGNAVLAYNLDLDDPLSPVLRLAFPLCRRAFEKSLAADADAVAKGCGLPVPLVAREIETLRREAALQLVQEALAENPNVTFRELRDRLIPDYNPSVHGGGLRMLQFACSVLRASRMIESKGSAVKVEKAPETAMRGEEFLPPRSEFLKGALAAGFANAQADSADGILRRPWLVGFLNGRPLLYLAFESAIHALEDPGHRVEVVISDGSIRLIVLDRSTGDVVRTVEIPVDSQGRVLVNWAGNRTERRDTGRPPFGHLPFHKLSQFFQERFEQPDKNFRRILKEELNAGETLPSNYREYLSISENPFSPGRWEKEARLEEIRQEILRDLRGQIAAWKDQLDKVPPRRREASRQNLKKWEDRYAILSAPVENEQTLRPLVEGKICVVGSASAASGDLHPTPLGDHTPGVDVQANVINMVLTGQFIRFSPGWLNFFYLMFYGVSVTLAVTYGSTLRSALAAAGLLAIDIALFHQLFVRSSIAIPGAGPAVVLVVTFASVVTYKEVVTQRSKRKLQKELARHTSEDMVSIILGDPEMISKPRKMVGTFLFSDIKGFTSMSEGMEPDVLFPFVNRCHDRMTQIIKKHRGFVDKYMGDGIMALFGIPVPTPTHAEDACTTALLSAAALRGLNERYAVEGLPQVWMRIGIHTGEGSSGYVGASDRSDYTVLGDNVNLASRLEGANKDYASNIIISESTCMRVKDRFEVRLLDNVRVVGRRQAVRIYELLAAKGEALPMSEAFLGKYGAGVASFQARQWQESIDHFEAALALKPDDRPCLIWVSRASGFLMSPPPDDWPGEFELLSK